MTRSIFKEYVAIDTNVFLHLFYKSDIRYTHVNALLSHLQFRNVRLIVDEDGEILKEYSHHIGQVIKRADVNGNEMSVMRYWLTLILSPNSLKVTQVSRDRLMTAIERVIHERNEKVDRIFVYVAFKQGTLLISNDETHIVVGPPPELGKRQRRDRLLRTTNKWRPSGAIILTSKEAHDKI